jgi:hypothetical protein
MIRKYDSNKMDGEKRKEVRKEFFALNQKERHSFLKENKHGFY